MPVLLTTAYCPTLSYVASIAREMNLTPGRDIAPAIVHIEACENYQKQSWRNRCRILTANGPEDLSFPIVHRGGSHDGIRIDEVELDLSTDWPRRHKMAIVSAYRSSAYFEYYRDELFAILDNPPARLLELNMALLRFFLEKTLVSAELHLTSAYEKSPEGVLDLREAIHPKREDNRLSELGLEKPYFQVFSRKYGFVRNLSVMDLLFNEGPDSILYLKKL